MIIILNNISLKKVLSLENAGIEPATLSMLRTRAANCANSPIVFTDFMFGFRVYKWQVKQYYDRYWRTGWKEAYFGTWTHDLAYFVAHFVAKQGGTDSPKQHSHTTSVLPRVCSINMFCSPLVKCKVPSTSTEYNRLVLHDTQSIYYIMISAHSQILLPAHKCIFWYSWNVYLSQSNIEI